MAKTKDNSRAVNIYVLSYFGINRIGDVESEVVGTFTRKDDALKAKRDSIKAYLEEHKALVDGEFHPELLDEIGNEQATNKTLDDALEADVISFDNAYYWRAWDVTLSVLH